MENQEKKTKPKLRPIRRISLSDNAGKIIDRWRNLLEEKYPGIKISDADLVGWCLEKQSPELSKKDIAEIESIYFDPVKQLEWMLAQAKLAKANKVPFTIEKRPHLPLVKKSENIPSQNPSVESSYQD